MSVQAMSWVFDRSEATGLERQILQSLANHANGAEPPWESYIGVASITYECRASRKGVQKALRRLQASGRLRDTGERRGGSTVYEIVLDAEVDVVDRGKRIAREASESRRPRGGANRVRPDEEQSKGEPSTPAEGEQGSPAGANLGSPGGELGRRNGTPGTPEPSGNHQEPSAADAAAASASAHGAAAAAADHVSVDDDPVWVAARSALVTARWSAAEVDEQAQRIRSVLAQRAARVAGVDWQALGAWLEEQRAQGRCTAPLPVSGLLFALNQRKRDNAWPWEAPPASVAAGVRRRYQHPPERVELPEPTERATAAWDELRSRLELAEGNEWTTWLAVVHPLRVDGHVLELSTQATHGASWIEDRLVPGLDGLAQRENLGRVRWVPPVEAASRRSAA